MITSRHDSGPGRLHPLVFGIVALKLGLHLFVNAMGGYGYFRDELYYLACSDHLDMGYVDHPPFSIFLLFVTRSLIGDSLFALRLLPALAGGATVLMGAMIARQMGGKETAQIIAALAVTISPVFMGMHSIFSMNAFDILFWALGFSLVLRILETDRWSDWLFLGLLTGIGAMNKISMIFWAVGIAAGFLLTPHRRRLTTPKPWAAAAIAVTLFLPYLIWNLTHDLAHLEFIRNASEGKYAGLTPVRFLSEQILLNNPFSLSVWGVGLAFFFTRMGKRYRVTGVAFLTVALILLVNQTSKAEYLAAGFTLLFAAGGVFCEKFMTEGWRLWLRRLIMVSLLAGFSIIPFGLPILPVDSFIRYADALGVQPMTSEQMELSALPQFYADMFGWEEQVRALADAYRSLPEEDQQTAVVYGSNYGRAGAVDFFGPACGLPPAISGHNNYWLWGPGSSDGSVVLLMSREIGRLREQFETVGEFSEYSTPYAIPYENNLKVFICRDLRVDMGDLWNEIRHYE